MNEAKPFCISKKEVWEAYKRVKENKGAAGVDGQSIEDFLQLPFQQNKFASNLFMVMSVSKVKACLQRAGFQPKFDSETVLFDGCNGQAVQLLQGKYRRPRVSE
jgi:hypothetical protein